MATTLQHLEPSIQLVESPHQLAPYMNSLGDASIKEFEQFADLVLSSSDELEFNSIDFDYDQQASVDNVHQSKIFSKNFENILQTTSWPSAETTTSCYSSASSVANSPHQTYGQANSPVDCFYSSFYSSSNFSSPSSSSPSSFSSSSSYPTSVASSVCGDSAEEAAHGGKPTGSGVRRRRNANAAERYRRKVKGRKSGLVEELERQQERNAKLKRQIRSKLALYSEFVALLAQNTRPDDGELAALGVRSLTSVFTNVVAAPTTSSYLSEQHEDDNIGGVNELADFLRHFKQIKQTNV